MYILYDAPCFFSEGTFSESFTFSGSLMSPLLQAHFLSPWLIRAPGSITECRPGSPGLCQTESGSEISPYFGADHIYIVSPLASFMLLAGMFVNSNLSRELHPFPRKVFPPPHCKVSQKCVLFRHRKVDDPLELWAWFSLLLCLK